jgi:ribosome-associated toxin RatA of RatAB toxin-antitoxin module
MVLPFMLLLDLLNDFVSVKLFVDFDFSSRAHDVLRYEMIDERTKGVRQLFIDFISSAAFSWKLRLLMMKARINEHRR